MHPIRVLNGSSSCAAIRLRIGAFHLAASRRSTLSAAPVARAVKPAGPAGAADRARRFAAPRGGAADLVLLPASETIYTLPAQQLSTAQSREKPLRLAPVSSCSKSPPCTLLMVCLRALRYREICHLA